MGCWNGTCYVSKLPIHAGDDIVLIILKERGYKRLNHNCHATDNYIPFGYPIYGKYDDYGGIEKIENADDVLEYLLTAEIYDDGKKEIITKESLEKFASNVGYYNYVVKESEEDETKEYKLDSIMVSRDLYEELIGYISKRKSGDKENEDVFKDKTKKAINSLGKYSDVTFEYPCRIYWWSNESCIRAFILNKLAKDFDEKQFTYLKNITFFTTALMTLRMGYYVVSGDGSQSQEMLMHRKLAEYVIRKSDERLKSLKADEYYKEKSDEELLTEYFSF